MAGDQHTLMVKDQGFDPEACISSPYGLGHISLLFLSALILALERLQTSKSVPNLGILRFDIGLTDQQLSDIHPLDCSTLWMLVLYLVGSLCFGSAKLRTIRVQRWQHTMALALFTAIQVCPSCIKGGPQLLRVLIGLQLVYSPTTGS